MNYYTSIILLCWLALIILGILVFENDRIKKKDKRLFYLTYILVAVASLMEWLGLKLNGNTNSPVWILQLVKCADYILTPVAGASLITHFKSRSIWRKLIVGVLILNTLFQIVSAFTGWTAKIDELHTYSHGSLYIVYMIFCVLTILLIGIEFITYGGNFRKHNRASLYAVLVLVFVSIIFQELLGTEYRTAYLGITLGLIMLFIHMTEFSQLKSDDMISVQRNIIETDTLTGVSSRHAYVEALNNLEDVSNISKCLTVYVVDINGLKTVNDILGHSAGDELICGAADCIQEVFGKKGKCYRTGGDEFVIFAELEDNEVEPFLQALKDAALKWKGEKVDNLRFAIGTARAADNPELTGEKLVVVADREMYTEKAIYYQSKGIDRRAKRDN